MISHVLVSMGDSRRALQMYEQAVALRPDSVELVQELFMCYLAAQDGRQQQMVRLEGRDGTVVRWCMPALPLSLAPCLCLCVAVGAPRLTLQLLLRCGHQAAMKMAKLSNDPKYFFWAALGSMSQVAGDGPNTVLSLAEMLMKRAVDSVGGKAAASPASPFLYRGVAVSLVVSMLHCASARCSFRFTLCPCLRLLRLQGDVTHSEAVGLLLHAMCRQGKVDDALAAFRGPYHFVAPVGTAVEADPEPPEDRPRDTLDGISDFNMKKVGVLAAVSARCAVSRSVVEPHRAVQTPGLLQPYEALQLETSLLIKAKKWCVSAVCRAPCGSLVSPLPMPMPMPLVVRREAHSMFRRLLLEVDSENWSYYCGFVLLQRWGRV
jgi:hypothetical protein